MTNSSPTKASTTERLWVPSEPTPIEDVVFDGALVLANRHASHGDEIDWRLARARSLVPILRAAQVIETAKDDDETVDLVRDAMGKDTSAPLLLWTMGGDNSYRCAARAAAGTATVVAGVGLGNGNVAQRIANSDAFFQNPEELLNPGAGVVRNHYLFEVIFNGELHYATTNAGFGETGFGAHQISNKKHRAHPFYKLREMRELQEYVLAFRSMAEIKMAKRCVLIEEEGETHPILGRDFMFGPEMAKVVDMPYAQLDEPEAIYFDLKSRFHLPSWLAGIQTGSKSYKRLLAGDTHSVTILTDGWAYIDGDPSRLQPGQFSIRCSPVSYPALTIPEQRTGLKTPGGISGLTQRLRPIVTAAIAR